MNLNEGKIGFNGTISVTALALTISGLFAFESKEAYSNGNSTYVTVPLGILVALLGFLLAAAAMRRARAADLRELLEYGLGKFFGKIACIFVVIELIIAAGIPLNRFLNLMHSYFFLDANYMAVAAFMLVAVLVPAWLGAETLTRTTRIFGFLLLFSQGLLLFNSLSACEFNKLSPLLGDGAGHMAHFTTSVTGLVMPAFLVLLSITRATSGIRCAKRSGIIAAISAAVVCFISQFVLSLASTYEDLAHIYTPLYRLSMTTGMENFVFRIDKSSMFLWLIGVMLCASFYIYGAAMVYTRSTNMRDIRPAVGIFTVVTMAFTLISDIGIPAIELIYSITRDFGYIIVLLPLVLASVIALIRSEKEVNERNNQNEQSL